jgi:hypothetical protein
MERITEVIGRITEYLIGSRHPIATAALVLVAGSVAAFLWLDEPRINGLGGVFAGLGGIMMLRNGTVRPPDALMTLGWLVVSVGFLIDGAVKVATGSPPSAVLDVAVWSFLVLAGVGYARFRLRVGVERPHQWFRGLFGDLADAMVPPVESGAEGTQDGPREHN